MAFTGIYYNFMEKNDQIHFNKNFIALKIDMLRAARCHIGWNMLLLKPFCALFQLIFSK